MTSACEERKIAMPYGASSSHQHLCCTLPQPLSEEGLTPVLQVRKRRCRKVGEVAPCLPAHKGSVGQFEPWPGSRDPALSAVLSRECLRKRKITTGLPRADHPGPGLGRSQDSPLPQTGPCVLLSHYSLVLSTLREKYLRTDLYDVLFSCSHLFPVLVVLHRDTGKRQREIDSCK